VSRSCRAHVRERGGSAFFERPRWREALTEIWRAADRRRCRTPRFETASEKLTHLDDLLQRAKGLLEERTGVKAEHFALPWAEGNEMISDVAAAAGVHHVYWEASIPEYTAGRQWEVRHHHRLKDQSLLRLPGEGRQGLWAVLGVVARSYLDR
jgi:hypothetical protein